MSQLFNTEAEVMIATAGKVDAVNANVQAELSRIRGRVADVQAVWAGDAQRSFDDIMQRYDVNAHKLQDALTAIADNIRGNAHHFSDVEASHAQSLNSAGAGLAL
ncbi:WXG100 family type VII secretion target [Corynebacterium uterequi]|uniref:ESAT-6-like protein n=1 Tax=Corynebacterium uterequi TaxID=1072256 RepID=A0A0G3HAP8_9CORY|nr:WXG100 family type VII secretion target [Corynebacterium uterequi]AKK10414.1 WXG100 family type VII secretion target [Corynebacterium uterequi]